ncbi:hypothetical protein EVAR_30680_1 [Eumeta japonica]|uniref:K Homology domain-containing protein n=1 Tax=Eumeta variegata TaxID=151549 RepID=A0A4C1VSA9_EUMVA|nr:hypothetical protein EVAR_30680_1 [Eumeta japonica]
MTHIPSSLLSFPISSPYSAPLPSHTVVPIHLQFTTDFSELRAAPLHNIKRVIGKGGGHEKYIEILQRNWCIHRSCTPTAICEARTAINKSVHPFAHTPQESVLQVDCEENPNCGLTRRYRSCRYSYRDFREKP